MENRQVIDLVRTRRPLGEKAWCCWGESAHRGRSSCQARVGRDSVRGRRTRGTGGGECVMRRGLGLARCACAPQTTTGASHLGGASLESAACARRRQHHVQCARPFAGLWRRVHYREWRGAVCRRAHQSNSPPPPSGRHTGSHSRPPENPPALQTPLARSTAGASTAEAHPCWGRSQRARQATRDSSTPVWGPSWTTRSTGSGKLSWCRSSTTGSATAR